MKWPFCLTLIRHDTSKYNELRGQKENDPLYREFLQAWKKNPDAANTRALAFLVKQKFALGMGDADTPLADIEGRQAYETGQSLANGPVLILFLFRRICGPFRLLTISSGAGRHSVR